MTQELAARLIRLAARNSSDEKLIEVARWVTGELDKERR